MSENKEFKCPKCGEVVMTYLKDGGMLMKPNPHKCKPKSK